MSDLISNILDDVNNVGTLSSFTLGDSGGATEAVRDNNSALDSSYAASAARGALVAQQTQVVKSTQEGGQLVAQTAVQQYAHSLGIDVDGSLSDQQAKAQQTFLDASSRAADAAATIAQKRSVSFFDDPLSWLSNKLTINSDIDNYNGAAGEANTAEQFIQESNQLVDARAVALNNIKTVTSQAAAESATKIAVEQQQELSENLRRAGIAANTQGVEQVQNMSYRQIQIAGAKLDADSKALSMQNQQAEMQLAQDRFGLEQQRFNLDKLKEQEKDGANIYLTQQLRKGLQLMYPNNPAAWNVPDGKFQAYLTGKTPLDPTWKKAFDVAQATDATGTGDSRILGTSPADTISTLQFKPTIAPGAQPTVDLLQKAFQQAAASPAYKTAIASKDAKGAEDIVNATVTQLVKSDASHVDSPTSLYYLPPVDKIADMNPGLKDSAFYQTVVAPAATAGIDLSQPDRVASLALKAVADGKITLNDAAEGMAASYAQGQAANFAAKQVFSLGIVAPPSYVAPTQAGGFFTKPVDWTNKIQVTEDFMRRSANVTSPTGITRNPLAR